MAERKVAWKPRNENVLLGTRVDRIDSLEKVSGAAKYAADINTQGTLFAKVLSFKGGHGRVTQLNADAAKRVRGVRAVHVFRGVGSELRCDGELIAAVAADRPEYADDGIRALERTLKIQELPFFVDEEDLEGAKKLDAQNCDADGQLNAAAEKQGHIKRTKPLRESAEGDVDEALKKAKVIHKGYYGLRTVTHMCMESHGCHAEWSDDGSLTVHLSTQNVSGTGGQLAGPLGLEQSKVTVICNNIGGGFGSKFAVDEWGLACAKMAKAAGRPVRLMLDRTTDQKIAGNRLSGFGNFTIAADADGKIVAWDSNHWGTGGIGGTTVRTRDLPYIFEKVPNRRRNATAISTNCGEQRAWRAPHHPQSCLMTDAAIDDLSAKLGMDSYDVFMKNLDLTARPEVYAEEMKIGAKLIDWKTKWHPHGKGDAGPVKRGLGIGLHTWFVGAHAATCLVKVHPDGTVESFGGSQDLGTGTRTVIAVVLAETFGLPLSAVKVNIGSSKYPQSGASGGSSTVGGVSGPNRRAALEALWKVFDLVAAKYKVDAGTLTARDQKIFSGNEVVCTWKQAASLIGVMPLEIMGKGPVKEKQPDGTVKDILNDANVGGVEMADVSVDTETGKIKINTFVTVQDCGLIISRKTAESQIYGAMTMGISYALYEERIMDNKTGRFLNTDLTNYKVPRIGDIGELIVHIYEPDSEYNRGVIGLGEPPVISGGAAISNAVANAIGVRVPVLPMTPKRVLDALKGGVA